jgi:hypothetical protein
MSSFPTRAHSLGRQTKVLSSRPLGLLPSHRWRSAELLCWIAGALGFSSAAWRWVASLSNYPLLLDHPSGAWATLATDLAGGQFYRPLASAAGYGGTRYFPVHLLAQAALIHSGLTPAMSGHILSLLSAGALALGIYALVRGSGSSIALSSSAAGMALGTIPAQWAITIARGDLLPAALATLGLARCRPRSGPTKHSDLVLTSAIFALAILAKPTAGFALAGALLAYMLSGQHRRLAILAGLAGAWLMLGLAATHLSSGGRWLQSLRACATGGTDAWQVIAYAPARLLMLSAPVDIALTCVAGALLVTSRRRWDALSAAWFFCAATTIAMFGSAGIGENHLLDWCALSIALVLSRGRRRARPTYVCISSFVCLSVAYATLRTGAPHARERLTVRGEAARLVESVANVVPSPSRGPLLAENPWIPLFLGERPFMLDAFNFRILAARDPAIAADLVGRLAHREFRAVVLMRSTDDSRWYEDVHFGRGFVDALRRDYALVMTHETDRSSSSGIYVYLPRSTTRPSLGRAP